MNKSLGMSLQVLFFALGMAVIAIAFKGVVMPVFQEAAHILDSGTFGR